MTTIPFYYGCIIIGPSGAGKTTLCRGISQLTESLLRKSIIINLDPANDNTNQQQEFKINIQNLITVEDVMKEFSLGYYSYLVRPNAALLYCFEFLLHNIDWLYKQLLEYKDYYLIFDFPGQIELYLANDSINQILATLTSPHNESLQIALVAVQLFDCLNCYQDNVFISQSLMNVAIQMNLSLPYISVLSKLDLVKTYGTMPMSLEYYLEADNLKYIIDLGKSKDKTVFNDKYGKFTYALAELMDGSQQMGFEPLMVEDKKLMMRLLLKMDKGNGYYYLDHKDSIYSQMQDEFADELDYLSTDLIMELENQLYVEDD